MGLGLGIVRAFVKAHFGTVELTSALGEGTTVTGRLPLRETVRQAELSQ